MVRCRALYSRARARSPRATLELAQNTVTLRMPDGRCRALPLNGSRFVVRDASSDSRFVRHLQLALSDGRADLITPPDEGAIAPRAAQLPGVPIEAAVIDRHAWDAFVDWLQGGGRMGGRSIAQLARLTRIASASFALTIGEFAARVAVEMTWERRGPLRGGSDVRHSLRPLEQAANHDPRAAEALVAALAHTTALLPRVPR